MVYTVDIGNMVLEELRGGSTQKKAALSHKTATTPRNLGSPLTTSKHTHKADPSDHKIQARSFFFEVCQIFCYSGKDDYFIHFSAWRHLNELDTFSL